MPQCLPIPHKPQYNGGIIRNPELDHGLRGWSKFGNPNIRHRNVEGNSFIVVQGRNHSHDSISQKIYLEKDKLYTLSGKVLCSINMWFGSDNYDAVTGKGFLELYITYKAIWALRFSLDSAAWVQVNEGEIPVQATFKTSTGFRHAGIVTARSKCWSMIKGGITVDASGYAELYFEVLLHACLNSYTVTLRYGNYLAMLVESLMVVG